MWMMTVGGLAIIYSLAIIFPRIAQSMNHADPAVIETRNDVGKESGNGTTLLLDPESDQINMEMNV